MWAWHLDDSPGGYRWGQVEDPVPGPGDVRVRPVASALNHMDLWLTKGLPRPTAFPHVPGGDVAGVVESVGDAVTDWAPGDEVVVNGALVPADALDRGVDAVLDRRLRLLGEHCWGGHGEYVVVPAHQLVGRPAGRSWVEAAAYGVATLNAWRLLRRAGLRAGEVVLVTGIGGGVATAAMALALHLGAEVHVTSRQESKRRRALELGAAAAYDSSASEYPLTADVVVDSIGPATWDAAMGCLRRGGRLCVCGGTSGSRVELDLPRLFFRQLDIIGASGGSPVEFDHVTALVAEGMPVVVDEVLPLAEYPAALELLRSGAQFGKIVLEHPA
jgi:NADPH:quinone reductase-like Zn-dependent oxidoreductase